MIGVLMSTSILIITLLTYCNSYILRCSELKYINGEEYKNIKKSDRIIGLYRIWLLAGCIIFLIMSIIDNIVVNELLSKISNEWDIVVLNSSLTNIVLGSMSFAGASIVYLGLSVLSNKIQGIVDKYCGDNTKKDKKLDILYSWIIGTVLILIVIIFTIYRLILLI